MHSLQAVLAFRLVAVGAETNLLVLAEQDSVRLLAVEGCGQLARLLTKEESVKDILPVVQKFSTVSCLCPQSPVPSISKPDHPLCRPCAMLRRTSPGE